MKVLVVNCGGSSIKFQVLDMTDESCLAKGSVEQVGLKQSVFSYETLSGTKMKANCLITDYSAGLKKMLDVLTGAETGIISDYKELAGVGHRVVHAGEKFTGSVMISEPVMDALRECCELAPLHNPSNIKGIEACQKAMPGLPQVGVFDNTLHRDLPPHVYLYALPYEYYEKYGVRRYGFHGISFDYMTQRASQIVGRAREEMRIVTLMLGSGCTANAMKYGKSVEVSTGFTPMEGLIQSTRAGDIDAGAVTHIMRKSDLTAEQMDDVLYRQSGWLGISGVSPEFRDVEEAAQNGHARARVALQAFAHRARKYIGAYMAVMGGIDMLVFGGGVGEKSAMIRELICDGLAGLNIGIDNRANRELKQEGIISSQPDKVRIVVVNTNEELVIARNTVQVLLDRTVTGSEVE